MPAQAPVLVTGAGGCVGAWLLKRFISDGQSVVAFDLSDDRRRLLLLCEDDKEQEAANAIAWETGDIADFARLRQVAQQHKPAAIVHLAALQVPFCAADPQRGARVNVEGMVNVLEAARLLGARVVYASSVAATANEEGSAGGWMQTLYGAYKVCNEQTARVYWQERGVASVGIRLSVVYGAARDQGMSAAPSLALLAAAAGRAYRVPFVGEVGFVYAADAAAAFARAALMQSDGAPVFALNGEARKVEDLLDLLRADFPQHAIVCEGEPLPFPARASNAPLQEFLGGLPLTPFANGAKQTAALFARRLAAGRLPAQDLPG